MASDGAHLLPHVLCAVPQEKGLLGLICSGLQNQQPVSGTITSLGAWETFSLMTPIANSLSYY